MSKIKCPSCWSTFDLAELTKEEPELENVKSYFRDDEVSCDCGCGKVLDRNFLWELNNLRHDVGMPFIINSGARCEAHNATIPNSAKRSAHILGRAVDVRITSPAFYELLIAKIDEHGLRRGIGYGTFVHVDNMLKDGRKNFDVRKIK